MKFSPHMVTIKFVTLPWFLNVIKCIVIHTGQRIIFHCWCARKYLFYTIYLLLMSVLHGCLMKHNRIINITIIVLRYIILCLRNRFIRFIDRMVAVGITNGKPIALIRLYSHSRHYEGRPWWDFLGTKGMRTIDWIVLGIVIVRSFFPSNHDLRLDLPQERT